jgi:Ni/Fe-hydrogenase subunit HybB-like protein
LNIVIPGLSPEEIAGITRAVDDRRITGDYFPSLLEWALAVGIASLGLVLFGLGEIFLPLTRRAPATGPRP